MIETSPKVDLVGMTLEQLTAFVLSIGLKPFRGAQIFQWMYRHGKTSFQEMTNIAKSDQETLERAALIGTPALAQRLKAADGTEKYLYRMGDGHCVEGVLIPDPGRVTLCVSTQAGCAMACEFCLTARGGLGRNLTTEEIVGQVFLVRELLAEDRPLTHLVLMGMGEPLANYENTLRAVKILLDPRGFDFSSRKVTLSTVGLIPAIRRLLAENIGIGLAVSLNAADSKTRDRLMPINRTYPM
ncbi:MAG: 23S rRNA (adenine(2503)-C(2))-methyltransferase RlmN, partial [bacterium]|nr:23S rRNA (adenine(2503)-C(2))-methyltransferase RlmN [bacterium]